MKLVIDGHRLTPRRTGVGRCLESLLTCWAEEGWPLDETWLVVRDPLGLARVPASPTLRTLAIGRRWPGLVWENLGLRPQLAADDVLLAPANLVPWSWHGRTVLILYDTLPWSVPSSFPRHVRWRFGWRYRLAARRASQIIVPSQCTARDVMRVHGIGEERITVAYPGPEPGFRPLPADAPEVYDARARVGLSAHDPYFLFVGKRSSRRNVPAILSAFDAHRRRFPEHRLLFVGPNEPGLPGRDAGVIDAGHVDEPTLQALLAAAVALLYPSNYEGFGLPVVEAQASGCPVVTLRNSALVESAGDAAAFLNEPTPAEIASVLERLATDVAYRSDLVTRGLSHVGRFSRVSFANVVSDVVRRVVHDSPRA